MRRAFVVLAHTRSHASNYMATIVVLAHDRQDTIDPKSDYFMYNSNRAKLIKSIIDCMKTISEDINDFVYIRGIAYLLIKNAEVYSALDSALTLDNPSEESD